MKTESTSRFVNNFLKSRGGKATSLVVRLFFSSSSVRKVSTRTAARKPFWPIVGLYLQTLPERKYDERNQGKAAEQCYKLHFPPSWSGCSLPIRSNNPSSSSPRLLGSKSDDLAHGQVHRVVARKVEGLLAVVSSLFVIRVAVRLEPRARRHFPAASPRVLLEDKGYPRPRAGLRPNHGWRSWRPFARPTVAPERPAHRPIPDQPLAPGRLLSWPRSSAKRTPTLWLA